MTIQRTFLLAATATLLATTALPASAAYRKRGNTAPLISGSPSTSVQALASYAFIPSASDAQKDSLTFSVFNKPAWASFSSRTGKLAGTPSATQAGTYANIVIRVSDGRLSASLPAFAITVTAAAAASNTAPTISGAPATSVTAGSAYSFTPAASDPDGNTLAFSVANKPAWATFATANGTLAGTPTSQQSGTYANILISVSDGTAASTLPAFTVTVNPSSIPGSSSATLSWSAPTQNTDGTSLTDLAGFKVYHGTSAGALTDVVQLEGAATRSYTYTQLATGTHYFAVSAITTTDAESALSTVGSKAIP